MQGELYKVGTRNVKNDVTGQWEKVPFYQVADQLPYGHGEKSVYLIEHFMRLKTAEPLPSAGTWAALTMPCAAAALPSATPTTPIPSPSSCISSDLAATYLMEQGTSEVENGHPKSK